MGPSGALAEGPARRRPSLVTLLAWLVVLVALVPFLPLAWLTWTGYRAELVRVEAQISESNRHIARLAANYLDTLLWQVEDAARLTAGSGSGLPAALPGVLWERLDPGGRVVGSEIAADRVGTAAGYAALVGAGAPGGLTAVGRHVSGFPPTVLVWAAGRDGGRVVGVLDPEALHEALLAWSGGGLDRHVYVVDGAGALLLYSDLDLSARGADLSDNPPVRLFLAGGSGELRYTSTVSGRERLGIVERLVDVPWGVVVSADPAGRVLDLRGRTLRLVASIVFAVAAALVLLLIASRAIVGPLLELRAALAAGDRPIGAPLAVRPRMRRLAEVDELVSAFDELSARYAATEGELVQAEKAALLGQLASGVAHEMGTPLNVITGNVQYLLRRTPEEGGSRPLLEQIKTQAERIASMIRRLLDFSRPARARLVAVELEEVVRRVLELVPDMGRAVHVEVVAARGVVPAMADPKLLEHVLLNLVVNAWQAMPGGGDLTLRIAADEQPEWVRLEVADTGCGIPEEHLERVFEPFFTTKAQGQGTGLGLAIVDRIVRQHGGRVGLASTPGVGTTVTIWLRAASAVGGER